jgi:hypothetical protein
MNPVLTRPSALLLAAGFLAVAGCEGTNDAAPGVTPVVPAAAAVTAAACGDAPALRDQVLEHRRHGEEVTSDQERIILGSRAALLASLAAIADLRCVVTSAAADQAMRPLFEAVLTADAATSFYQRAAALTNANFHASQAIEFLVRELSGAVPSNTTAWGGNDEAG